MVHITSLFHLSDVSLIKNALQVITGNPQSLADFCFRKGKNRIASYNRSDVDVVMKLNLVPALVKALPQATEKIATSLRYLLEDGKQT